MLKGMKNLIIVFFSLVNFFGIAQVIDQKNAYRIESEGYYINPVSTPYGIVITDNYCSSLYLIDKQNNIKTLHSSPGCGRYYTISDDKSRIGFKLILNNGMQIPAIYNLGNQNIIELHKPVEKCGQVDFGNKTIVFTISNRLYIINEGENKIIELDNYSNIIKISHDNNFVVFSDNNEQLIIKELYSGKNTQITNGKNSYLYPKWSPCDRYIVYSSINGDLFLWDFEAGQNYKLGKGGGANWSPGSKKIIYQKSMIKNFKLLSSDIYMFDAEKFTFNNLTENNDQVLVYPTFLSNNEILFLSLNNQQMFNSQISANYDKLSQTYIKADLNKPDILFFNNSLISSCQKDKLIWLGNVEYIHQVYDTPDFHDGSGSCGPTTAVMALAYFNKLPKWKTGINKLYFHYTDYGSYVADKYHFNEIYYDTYTSPYGSDSWGAYSFMWYNSSPGSKLWQYYENHFLETEQYWSGNCFLESTINQINSGFPHTICHYMTQAGHITLAIGYISGQGTLLFNDPNGNKNTPEYPSYDGQNVYYDWPGYNNGFQNLDPDGTHGGVAWTVSSQGFEPEYNDTIIDDLNFDHGFYMFNEPPSHMEYFRDNNSGYNDHMWWTYTIDDDEDVCFVTWKPNLQEPGRYHVLAFIPGYSADAENVNYIVSHSEGETIKSINQNEYNDQWVSLGIYNFIADSNTFVYLGDKTGHDLQKIGIDAVKWSKDFTIYNKAEYVNGQAALKVYPNPFTGELAVEFYLIETNDVHISLTNIVGQETRIIEPLCQGNNKIIIRKNKYGFKSGLYLLTIQGHNFKNSIKVYSFSKK